MLCVNAEKPKRGTRDYQRMYIYRREKSSLHDQDFKNKLDKAHPDWFPKDTWYQNLEYIKGFLKRNKGK